MDQFQFIIDKGKNTFKEIYENRLTDIEKTIERLLNFVYEKISVISSKNKDIKISIEHEKENIVGTYYEQITFKITSEDCTPEEYRNFINEYVEVENFLYFIKSNLDVIINNKLLQIKTLDYIDILIFKEKDGEKNEIAIDRNHSTDDFTISIIFNIKEKE